MGFFNFNEMPFVEKRENVLIKSITGGRMQMLLVRLKTGEKTYHSHPHEQMGYILSGRVELTIEDDRKVCGKGEAYYIPSSAFHGFEVLSEDGLEYIEIFSPPKDENNL
jgi:quercetin dioxygenase-like cupin family protein